MRVINDYEAGKVSGGGPILEGIAWAVGFIYQTSINTNEEIMNNPDDPRLAANGGLK